jgi:hypothetical protein
VPQCKKPGESRALRLRLKTWSWISRGCASGCFHLRVAKAQEPDIPKEYRAEVAAIKEIMFITPLSSEQGYVPRQISDEDGAKLAQRILSLFTAVMGGL